MRVAVCALHFGKEYLAWAVRGVQDAVDEIHIHYAPQPSYGFSKGLPNPDTEAELVEQAHRFATKPIKWFRVSGTSYEGQHRMQMDTAARAAGAEMYVVFDADEVWSPTALGATLSTIKVAGDAAIKLQTPGVARWLTRFANFWRSFRYQLDDGFMPIRVVDCRFPMSINGRMNDAYLSEETQPEPVYHFGYVQTLATMRYKLSVHSHTAELRPNWLEEKFIPWKPGDADCHPTAFNLWTPRPTTPGVYTRIRALLHDHPYRDLESVE